MQLHASRLKPRAAAFCKFGRLWYFDETQYVDVKGAGFIFPVLRYGELYMVDGEDFHLWFRGVASVDPGFKSAEHGLHVGVSVIDQEERRTGARMFVRSGAVGDDPLVFFERKDFGY
jgi:hypothetical protein